MPRQPVASRATPSITAITSLSTGLTPHNLPQAEKSPTSIPQPTKTPVPNPTAVIPPPEHIILLMVDSLRADHTSAYGYSRQTTPNLEAQVAAKGVRFDTTISTAPWTCPAVAAVHTGRNSKSLGFSYETMSHTLPDSAGTLAEYLHKAGYFTAGFSSTYCTQGRLGFSQGFDLYDDTFSNRSSDHKALAVDINQHVLDWVDNQWPSHSTTENRLFLFIYYFDPHVWYDPPPPYAQLYDSGYIGPLTSQGYGIGQPVVSGEIQPDERDIEHLQALYDGEIRYWDQYLGELLTALGERHLLDNTLLVVTADHGEMFGEHQKWTHMSSLYEEVLRIPLLMRYDGVIPAGTSIQGPVQNYDLMPTILEWAGIPIPQDLQAASLKKQILDGSENLSRPVFAEVNGLTDKKSTLYWNAPRNSQFSIEQDGWKLIHTLGNSEPDELYYLKGSSLYETQNLVRMETSRAALLLQRLKAWFNLSN